MSNPFIKPTDSYKRDINFLKHYIDQSAHFLHIQTKKPIEECIVFVTKAIKDKKYNTRNLQVEYTFRKENGDREKKIGSYYNYIQEAVQENQILAPTLTVYTDPLKKESVLVTYVDDNKKARSLDKKQQFIAEANGNHVLAAIKYIAQTNKKLVSNALSGAHVSASTPLSNKTAHSTLTSLCRTTSGLGNANNEKFVSGNRHYWNVDIVLNNITSITLNIDYKELKTVMDKYNIVYPTIEQTMECISYSTKLYWERHNHTLIIQQYISKLTDIQRAAFVYVGDFYHLRKYNPQMVRQFIQKLSMKVTDTCENAKDILKKADGDFISLVHLICQKETVGIGKDYSKISDDKVNTVASTYVNTINTINDYKDLIHCFFASTNVPASVSYFPSSIRRVVTASDTDSTIFTVQEWVHWYKNGPSFDDEAVSVAAAIIFLASQTITHILAIMSANIGVTPKRTHDIVMKNEFFFPVFATTPLNKHYYAYILAQEGNIKPHLETEIKGVHLKNSNVPKNITNKAKDLMCSIMQDTMDLKKISLKHYLTQVADFERQIKKSLESGGTEYYKILQIKSPKSYKKGEESSSYAYHLLWEEVFAQSYGNAPPPTYSVLKIPTTLINRTTLLNWINSIKDVSIRLKMIEFIKRTGKTSLPTLQIPIDNIDINGMPECVATVIDFRRIILDLCGCFYMVLKSIGYFKKDNELISDFY